MTHVLALAGGVATAIFERAKGAILLDAGEFGGPANFVAPVSSPHRMLERRSGRAVARLIAIVYLKRTAGTARSVPFAAGSTSNACFPFATQSARACSP